MSDKKAGQEVEESLRVIKRGRRGPQEIPNPVNIQGEDQLPEGSKAMQDAMSNHLVLKCIFGYLRTADLIKCCRLVNQEWSSVATDLLKKRTDAYVKIRASTDFEALTACIRHSSDFPFREIDLKMDKEDFENSPEEWLEMDLFRQYSTVFTRLRLESICVPDIVLWGLFSGPFSHLESVTLDRVERKKMMKRFFTSNYNDNHLDLAKLKTLKMGKDSYCDDVDSAFLEALLRCCPNLVVAENFTNAHLPAFSTAKKLETVKSLQVCQCVMRQEKNCPKPTGVEVIRVRGFHHDVIDADDEESMEEWEMEFDYLQPLLEANRETLQHIEVCCDVYGGKLAKWPKLTRLTSLKLIRYCDFPDSVDEVFPALETIQLAAEEDSEWFYWFDSIMWKEPLSSVTKLEICSCFVSEDWECVVKAVPNIHFIFIDLDAREKHRERLSLSGDDKYGVDVWDSVSHFKHLQKIHISPIQLHRTNLDEFFTGIPAPTLKKLRANAQSPVPHPLFVKDVLREKGSVASLPDGLKELDLYFKLSDKAGEQDFKKNPPISHVALQYGLKMAPPDLKIRFMYDHCSKNANLIRDALSPVSERVTFEHWNTNQGP